MQKIYRLTLNGSFKYIYRKGTVYGSEFLILYAVPAHKLKVGISVAKKVGNSVCRSKVKRRIGESFRLLIPRVKQEFNFVIVARSKCNDATYREIESDLLALLGKGGFLIEEVKQ